MNHTPTQELFPVKETVRTRRAPRRRLQVPVDLVSHACDDVVPLELQNLSPFGLWVDTLCPLQEGAEVVVCFEPPGGKPLMVFAEVRRTITGRRKGDRGRVGMGIEFTDITYDEMVMVDHCLRDHRAA
ncbi:MAG: PilZ domain-containing protein [Polyangiaceae bacterium]